MAKNLPKLKDHYDRSKPGYCLMIVDKHSTVSGAHEVDSLEFRPDELTDRGTFINAAIGKGLTGSSQIGRIWDARVAAQDAAAAAAAKKADSST